MQRRGALILTMGAKNGKFKWIEKTDPLVFWQIKGDLGAGSYGKVHLVQNRQDRSEAAAKVADIDEENDLLQFTGEIDILATCRHPNITAFLAAYYDSNKLWIVIEKCSGGAVNDAMSKRGAPMNETEVAVAAAQSISAVEFLHMKCIIHRDLNAANILISGDGAIKIADFGVSAHAPKGKRNSFIGSPCWMAPEVIRCEQKPEWYTNLCDIWSLGITLIEFAEMQTPYHDLHPAKAMIRIVSGADPKLSNPAAWNPGFSDLLGAMLIKDPMQRKSAAALSSMPFVRGKETGDLSSILKATTQTNYENWQPPPRPMKVEAPKKRARQTAEPGGRSGYGIPAELLD